MNKILRLKHWHLFILVIGFPLLYFLVSPVVLSLRPNHEVVLFGYLFTLLFEVVFIAAWFYSAGTFLHSQHPPITHLNLKIFKLSLLVPLTYLVLICILVIIWYFYFDNVALLFERSRKLTIAINSNPFIFLLLMGTLQVLLLASILCVFYSIYFIVRALNIIEMGHSASFLDFTVDFLSILLFPVGLFYIQPRINRIMNNSAP